MFPNDKTRVSKNRSTESSFKNVGQITPCLCANSPSLFSDSKKINFFLEASNCSFSLPSTPLTLLAPPQSLGPGLLLPTRLLCLHFSQLWPKASYSFLATPRPTPDLLTFCLICVSPVLFLMLVIEPRASCTTGQCPINSVSFSIALYLEFFFYVLLCVWCVSASGHMPWWVHEWSGFAEVSSLLLPEVLRNKLWIMQQTVLPKPFFFLIGSNPEPGAHQLARMAGQQASGIILFWPPSTGIIGT